MRVVLMGGSLRPESLNTRLLGHLATELAARGHELTLFAGEALRLPLYEQDLPAPAGSRPSTGLSWVPRAWWWSRRNTTRGSRAT